MAVAPESRLFTQATIYGTVALVFARLVWSFFGHTDVRVTASARLVPAFEVRHLCASIDGELTNTYIAEGQLVNKGNLVAGCTRAARSRWPRMPRGFLKPDDALL